MSMSLCLQKAECKRHGTVKGTAANALVILSFRIAFSLLSADRDSYSCCITSFTTVYQNNKALALLDIVSLHSYCHLVRNFQAKYKLELASQFSRV